MSVVDPITAVLDAVKARVIEALGSPWQATETMLPVSARAFEEMVRRPPHALVGWTDWRGGGATREYSAPIKLQVVLVDKEMDVAKAARSLNASLCRAAVALRRHEVRAVLASGVDPTPIGTLQLDGLAPAFAENLRAEGYVMAALDLSMRLTLDDWLGEGAALPDFENLAVAYDLPGTPDAGADVITVQEGS